VAMKYLAPKTLNETLILLKKGKDKSKLIAGGTNVIPDLRAKAVNPQVLIDIRHLKIYLTSKRRRRGFKSEVSPLFPFRRNAQIRLCLQ
jgi:CO/xanthine dehydrogenase FAD-binding subunit